MTSSVNTRLIQNRPGRRSSLLFLSQRSVQRGDPFETGQSQPPLLTLAERVGDDEHERQANELDGNQRPEKVSGRDVQRRRRTERRAGPGQEIYASGHRGSAGEDALVHPKPVVQRQHAPAR